MGKHLSRIAVTAGLAAVLSLPAGAATSEWRIDPQHSYAQFSARHMAISPVRGAFSQAIRTIALAANHVTKSTVNATIAASAAATRQRARQNDFRSAKIF